MDNRTFDSLIRSLTAATAERRDAIKGLFGAALGLSLGQVVRQDTEAKKKKCKPCQKKKKGKCKGSESCGAGRLCVFGTCVTGAGTCPEDVSICHDPPFADTCNGNPNCHCYTKVVAGTRCGTKASTCGACTVSEQCASFGVGSTCVVPTVDCDCPTGQGFCITPCAS
jgi:hypothetical protein